MQLDIKRGLWKHMICPSFLPSPSEICCAEILDFFECLKVFCGRSGLKVDRAVNHRRDEAQPFEEPNTDQRETEGIWIAKARQFIHRRRFLMLPEVGACGKK
jgi:hypothetical protein